LRALRYAGPCRIPGALYDLGAYPALLPGRGEAAGDLFEIVRLEALARLDAYEGCDPNRPAASLYRREAVRLLAPGGMVAWVYIYNRPAPSGRRIASGDWLACRIRNSKC